MNDNQSDTPLPWHTKSSEDVMKKLETSKNGLSDYLIFDNNRTSLTWVPIILSVAPAFNPTSM